MPSKEELAALMASDGDFEKKISLLKKAVVTVTKQKREIEERQTQLQGELSTATQQLAEAQRANAALQRKVKSLEAQLEQERSSGSAFSHNMLKGLSSIMGNSDGNNRGGARGERGAANDQLSLSAEDVERLISENEQLHRQIYTFKTKLEEVQQSSTKDVEKLRSEVTRLQRDTQELRCSLEASTASSDLLRADYLTERALGDFCRHFFVAELLRSQQGKESFLPGTTVEMRWPAKRSSSNSVAATFSDSLPEVVRERVSLTLKNAAGTIKTLLRGVSVLAVVLQEQLPSRERATVGDLECLRDRLSVFLKAHTAKKDDLMQLLEQLDSQLSALQQSDEEGCSTVVSADAFVEAQDTIMQRVLEWIGFLRAQVPLLVESCVSILPYDHSYTIHTAHVSPGNGDGIAAPRRTTVERGEFVKEVTRNSYAILASIEGSLTAMRMLVQGSPTAYSRCYNDGSRGAIPPEPPSLKETLKLTSSSEATQPHLDLSSLLALQQFWWEGCASLRSLRASIGALSSGLVDMAEACNKSEIRDALNYLCKCLKAIAGASQEMSTSSADADVDAAVAALAPEAFAHRMPAHVPSSDTSFLTFRPRAATAASSSPQTAEIACGTVGADNYEELLVALSAADRAAASYYTQMNYLYVELAEKEDAVQTSLEAVAHLQKVIVAERAESKHTREALQSQISILSTQLVSMSSASPAQSPP